MEERQSCQRSRPARGLLFALLCSLSAIVTGETLPVQAAGNTTPPSSHQAKSDLVGLVVNISGKWVRENGSTKESIRQGDGIPEGWRLTRTSTDGSITIAKTDGETLKCPGCAGCSGALTLTKHEDPANNWIAKAVSIFVQKPRTWAVAESRTAVIGQPALQDAVVLSTGNNVDLKPIFASATDGSYFLSVYKIAPGQAPTHCLGPEPLNAHKDTSVNIAAKLTPGLYRVNVSADKEELGDEAWILVASPQSYEQTDKQFQKAVLSSKTMATEESNTIRELLRAYLSSLDTVAASPLVQKKQK